MTGTKDPHPLRLLIVDFTPAGNGTATGELKSTVLTGMQRVPIMQVSSAGEGFDYSFPNVSRDIYHPSSIEDLLAQIDWFAPTLILARPTAEHENLWLLALALRVRYSIPILVWVMDDWLSVMGDTSKRQAFEASLSAILSETGKALSICEEMSTAFGETFGIPFEPIANGIDLGGEFAGFTPRTSDPDTPFVFRYAGALAHNMGVDTLERVAQAVRQLRRDGLDVCFEIRTRRFWVTQQGRRFTGLEGVQLAASDMDRAAYLGWLSEADCNLICYNFSELSQRYVKFSLANKLPELLGCGAPVLGIGPAQLPTIARLRDHGAGFHLSNADPDAIYRCLRDIVINRHRMKAVATRGRAVAEAQFSLRDAQSRFLSVLQSVQPFEQRLDAKTGLVAAKGLDASLLPKPIKAIATPVKQPAAPDAVEIPERLMDRASPGDASSGIAVPPRPTHSTAGLCSEDLEPDLHAGKSRRLEINGARGNQSDSLPLKPEIPEGRASDWLAELTEAAKTFQRRAPSRPIGAAAREPNPADLYPSSAFFSSEYATVMPLNGAALQKGEAGAFTVERLGAPPLNHAEVDTAITDPVGGLRIEVEAVRGKVEFLAASRLLATVKKPGTFDVVFPQPSVLEKISIRCLDSTSSEIRVASIVYLDAAQLEVDV